MDEAVRRFRRQAREELGTRQGTARRYSPMLQHATVVYWRAREQAGDGLRDVATALGVAPMSLQRWAHAARFTAVQVVPDAASPSRVSVIIDGGCVRLEGLDLETAVQVITRLR